MSDDAVIQVYDSRSAAYQQAFRVFLDHTDQKERALDWLDREVSSLPERDVFVDAGAGNGKLTHWLTPRFRRTIAFEPNRSLFADLAATCPMAEVHPLSILEAHPGQPADFVLCSHVFYYIDGQSWLDHLRHMSQWLRPRGTLAATIQNQDTDCMRMLHHFTGNRFDLRGLARDFGSRFSDAWTVELHTVPAFIQTGDPETALTIAEFMLNLVPLVAPPARESVARYLHDHFLQADGVTYRLSCHQDFLRVRCVSANFRFTNLGS